MAKQLRRYRELVSDWQTYTLRKIKRARTDPERDVVLEKLADMVIKGGVRGLTNLFSSEPESFDSPFWACGVHRSVLSSRPLCALIPLVAARRLC